MTSFDSAAICAKRPVLYLDWDGVVNFFGSRNQYLKKAGFGYLRRGSAMPRPADRPSGSMSFGPFPLNWSAELLRKLAALPVDIVFLSTWRHSFSELLKATQWELENYRILDWTDGPRGSEHAGKVPALLADQLADPRPFIWADDEAHSFYTEDDRAKLAGIPQLLLAPSEALGLTADDYATMLSFLNELNDPGRV